MSELWTPSTLRVGFRFAQSQAKRLDNYADQFEVDGHHEHVTLFRQAAYHARQGEPLIVEAETPGEAKKLAAGFAQYPGIREPEIVSIAGTT